MSATSLRFLAAASLAALSAIGCARQANQHQAILRYDRLPAEAYAVVADVRARPGREGELRAATLPLVAQVRAEPDNLLYFLHEDREAPGHFVFYEIFASQADFEAHNATAHVQAWFERLHDLADGDVRVVRLRILGNASQAP